MSLTTILWMPPTTHQESSGVLPSYDLTSGVDGIRMMPGAKGLDAPPFQIHYDEMPALDGAYSRHSRATSREIFLPLFLEAATRAGLMELKRSLLASFNPAYGEGKLVVTEPDETARFISVQYVSGAEGDEGVSQSGVRWLKYGVVLRAFDPYWYSGSTELIEFTPGALNLKKFFGEPFLGLALNSTQTINGVSEVSITGDVDTWPIWYVSGPGGPLSFTRRMDDAAELTFELAVTLNAGDQVVIDTRPGRKSVINETTGENLWNLLGPNPQLWPIAPGVNEVQINMGAAGAESAVTMTYTPRYISA